MSKPDRIREYLNIVSDQIRWKKARSTVTEELETHILDQRDTFIHSGQDDDTATKNAIAEMGDAVTIGTMLDQSYRPRMNWKVLVGMLALIVCSCLLTVLLWRSGSYADLAGVLFAYIALYVGIALPFSLIDFTCYAKIPKILFLVLVTCLILSAAGVRIFWRTDGFAAALLPFSALLIMFGMRGGGYRKFIQCSIIFVVLPCVGYFIYLYFRYYGSWRTWAVTENFIVFILSSVAMMIICICNGFL